MTDHDRSIGSGHQEVLAVFVDERALRIAQHLIDTRTDLTADEKADHLETARQASVLTLSPEVQIGQGSLPIDVTGLSSFRETLIPLGTGNTRPEGEEA